MSEGRSGVLGVAAVWAVAATLVCGVVSPLFCLRWDRVGQNESAIQTRNGVIAKDHLSSGLQFNWSFLDKVEYPRVSHTTQSFAITAIDKGQHCDADCVTLQTHDQQTVTGSLGIQWHIERATDKPESVMAELYNLRGATSTTDIQEKFLVPHFTDCMIQTINKTNAGALVDQGHDVVDSIKRCAVPRVKDYHIIIEEVFDRGFGPSAEARQSMRRFADARQDGQVADIQMETSAKREAAMLKNVEIWGAAYNQLVKMGVPPPYAVTGACLADSSSKERPCVPYTASGGSAGVIYGSQQPAAASAPH